jgi:hypothetical protein
MKIARTASALVLALLVAAPVLAAAKKKADGNNGIEYYRTVDRYLKPVTLTDDQKTKLADLKKEYEPKFKEAYANQNIWTPEQKPLVDAAKKAATAAGKKGKELTDAVADAAKETDDQKKAEKSATRKLNALKKEMHGKVVDLLTDDQKAQIAAKPSTTKKAKPATPVTPDPAAPAATPAPVAPAAAK